APHRPLQRCPSNERHRRTAPSPACTPPLSRLPWPAPRTCCRTVSSAATHCRRTHTTVPLLSPHRDRPPCRPRQYRVTAGQRCPSYRRAISETQFLTLICPCRR